MADRRRITVTGTVQGVGFRPYVYRLASRFCLAGSVKNEIGTVLIDIEGESSQLEGFEEELRLRPPPLARIERVRSIREPPTGARQFTIAESGRGEISEVYISPDIATCEDCLRELLDPKDRRYRYPFLNCVNCGPRLTIIEGLPYDRSRTTMRRFPLCEECRREYDDPLDRRFHAQPVACARCGPRLSLLDSKGHPVDSSQDAIAAVARAIEEGQIVAIKGLGGYHLACDATHSPTVSELRRRKHRNEKPLALMLRDLDKARQLCCPTLEEERLLISERRPIVLLRKRDRTPIASEVGFQSPRFGVMLPYTPLHHLLLHDLEGLPLVMTSGNDSDQPIAYDDRDAIQRLSGIADLFLVHDREIHTRCDDSVLQQPSGEAGKAPVFIRRSRGFAPGSIRLPFESREPVLATGAQLKNTFAVLRGAQAILSHHIGDLGELAATEVYRHEITRYEELFRIRPRLIAHDLHPDYSSTLYARERARREGIPTLAVQHHHAHMASCMAENGIRDRTIGVVFDGTGYGTDGKIWGGEFLLGDFLGFERAAHLRYIPMPGGELAILEPWRMAFSQLLAAGLEIPEFPGIAKSSLGIVERMIARGFNAPLTSSMGRLFDAVSCLLGLRNAANYEGQAAIELEWLASEDGHDEPETGYCFALSSEWPVQIDPAPVLTEILRDLKKGTAGPVIARRFHSAIADLVGEICDRIRARAGCQQVVLSGGVFMNQRLLAESVASLRNRGFEVFRHERVPPNDGGISLGQLAVAAAKEH